MTFDEVESVIWDNIPEILNIGDYRGRLEKCIDIIKNSHSEFVKFYNTQESDDILDMLDTFLIEDEAHGYLKETNMSALCEVEKIMSLCSCCTYEYKEYQILPIHLISDINPDHKISILGIKIGDSLLSAKKNLERYGLKFCEKEEDEYIKIENKLVDGKNLAEFHLRILYNNNQVTGFYLHTTNYRGRWKIMGSIDNIFGGLRYKIDKCTEDYLSLTYFTYYEDIKVRHEIGDTHIFIDPVGHSLTGKKKPWWKF